MRAKRYATAALELDLSDDDELVERLKALVDLIFRIIKAFPYNIISPPPGRAKPLFPKKLIPTIPNFLAKIKVFSGFFEKNE